MVDRDDIIKLAQEAGFATSWTEAAGEALERFAALIAAREREACVALCERLANRMMSAEECSEEIRQRGDAIDISQERVDETAKHEHEFFCPRCGHCCRDGLERLIRIMGTFDLATGHADTMDEALDALESELRDVLGYLRAAVS